LEKELAHEKSLKDVKDIYLVEAAHIVSDAAGLWKSGPRFAGVDKATTPSRSGQALP
jgi:hypothetical protein